MTATNTETNQEPKNPSVLRRVLKVFLGITVVFVLLFAGAATYLYTHQEHIKEVITSNLNAQLNTEVSVGKIEIDFFQKFPEVSIKFNNVTAKEALKKSEQSLFLFKNIFVRFSILDLLGEDYTIRKLSFDDGEANLRVTKQGEVNYIFWKESSEEQSSNEATIALENVEINNAKIRYIDQELNLRVILQVAHLKINGGYQKNTFTSQLKGAGVLEDLTLNDLDFADSLTFDTKGSLLNAQAKTEIDVQELVLQGIPLSGKGFFKDDVQQWNIVSENARLHQWLPIIPRVWRPKINPAQLGGDAKTTVQILLSKDTEDISANTTFSNASLQLDKINVFLKNASGNISFAYAHSGKKTSSSLQFRELKAETKTGNLALNLDVTNLISPQIFAKGSFNLKLEELLEITRPGLLESGSGIASGSFSYQQNFKNWDDLKANAFTSPKLEGKLNINDAAMRFLNSNIELSNISAELLMNNKDLRIERLFLREKESEFLLDGWLYDALYFGENRPRQKLSVRLQSSYLDLDRILEWQLPKKAKADSSYSTDRTKPFAFDFNLLLDVKKINLIEFNGFNVKGEIWNDGLKIKGKKLTIDALGGNMTGNFSWSTELDGYAFWTNGNLSQIDIHELFNGFKNFGQNWLLADNIYGTGTASLETSMKFANNLEFIPSSFKLITDITIKNGRLKGYLPLMSLSSIVDKSALNDVKFSTLQNQIAISNEVITIPQMEINSSALNLLLQGRHSFDQQIDYSIRLALKDVIGKKRKDKKTDLDNWIVEVETTDQPYIWVHVGCSIADPCLTLDRELLKQGVKKEWKQQGEDIKNIFKPDKNTTPKKDPTKGEVIFEWNEEEPDTTSGK